MRTVTGVQIAFLAKILSHKFSLRLSFSSLISIYIYIYIYIYMQCQESDYTD